VTGSGQYQQVENEVPMSARHRFAGASLVLLLAVWFGASCTAARGEDSESQTQAADAESTARADVGTDIEEGDTGPDLPSEETCEAVCGQVYETCGFEFRNDERMPINRQDCYSECLYGFFDGAETSCLREVACDRREVFQCVRDAAPGDEVGEPCESGTDWPDEWAQFEQRVVELTNERRSEGATCGGTEFDPAPALEMDAKLRCAARSHSRDMADREYFAHESPEGDGPAARVGEAGYTFSRVGENIFRSQPSPEDVVEGWMNSPGHCRNIMKPSFTEIGVGYVGDIGTDYRQVWTQVFGTPR
jgi:uncharacterized protein YkwD